MSPWTNERHEAARARCEAATAGPWEDQPDRTGTATIVLDQEGDALWDAVGTLRDEDGEFIAHARADIPALLGEIERLSARTTITDDMVERLAKHQNDAHLTTWEFPWRRLSEEDKKAARAEARWALEAALNPPA